MQHLLAKILFLYSHKDVFDYAKSLVDKENPTAQETLLIYMNLTMSMACLLKIVKAYEHLAPPKQEAVNHLLTDANLLQGLQNLFSEITNTKEPVALMASLKHHKKVVGMIENSVDLLIGSS